MSTTAVASLTWSVEQAAARLGVGARWLADAARRGTVPHRRLGRARRFAEEDLQAILAARRAGEAAPDPWERSKRSRSRRRGA